MAEHGPTVLRVCRAVLGPADADDAWSETFLAALRAYPDLPAGRERRGLAGDDRAPQGHRRHPRRGRAARPGRRRCPTAAARPARRTADARPVGRARPRCPPKQRQAVAYHYLAGLPYAEIADILGGSADAARRAAADGIATLRRTYRDRRGRRHR